MSPKCCSHNTMRQNLSDCDLPRKHFDDEKKQQSHRHSPLDATPQQRCNCDALNEKSHGVKTLWLFNY